LGGGGNGLQAFNTLPYPGVFSTESGILIPPLLAGSGKSVMPWLRMHRENLSACAETCYCWVAVTVGHRDWQACCAAWSWELLTPTCCRLTLGIAPPLVGSGNAGTPWVRMQLL